MCSGYARGIFIILINLNIRGTTIVTKHRKTGLTNASALRVGCARWSTEGTGPNLSLPTSASYLALPWVGIDSIRDGTTVI